MKKKQYKFIGRTIIKHCKTNLYHTVKVLFVYICFFLVIFTVDNDLKN